MSHRKDAGIKWVNDNVSMMARSMVKIARKTFANVKRYLVRALNNLVIILSSRERITKALISRRGGAGWSAS